MKGLLLWTVIFLTGFLIVAGVAVGQVSPTDSAAADFAAGKYQAVIKRSKDSKGVRELYYLGLSYEKLGLIDDAANAYKKCFSRAFDDFRDRIQLATKDRDDNFQDLFSKASENSKFGSEAAQKLFGLRPGTFTFNDARLKANVLSDAAALGQAKGEIVGDRSQRSDGVKIIHQYTPSCQACSTRVGEFPMRPITTRLLVVYGADGTIRLTAPLDDMLDAFTMASVKAVRETKFEPALVKGVPVNYVVQFEAHFRWY